MTLDDLLARYTSINPRITSSETTRRYRTTARNLARYLRRDATTDDLTDDTYGAWIKWRRDSTTAAAGTIRGDAEKLLVLWRWAAKRDLASVPNVVLPAKVELEPVAWTQEELARLERAARTTERLVGGVPGKLYWPALIGLAVDTGERINAIHALAAADIDTKRRIVVYRRETRKGKRKDSVKPFSKQTAVALDRWLASEHRPALPFQVVKYSSLYTPMRWLLVDAGLPRDRRRMFHCLRRTHGTRIHLQGGDASVSLDHSDPRTTRAYIDRSQLPVMLPEREGLLTALRRRFRRWGRVG